MFLCVQSDTVKALCLMAATRWLGQGTDSRWPWLPASCSNTAILLVIPSHSGSTLSTFPAFLGYVITPLCAIELPVGQSESHSVEKQWWRIPAGVLLLWGYYPEGNDSRPQHQLSDTRVQLWCGCLSCVVFEKCCVPVRFGGGSEGGRGRVAKQEQCGSSISNYLRAWGSIYSICASWT